MGQTSSNADAVLKEWYPDKIIEAVKQEMKLLDWFKRRDEMPSDGRRVVYPVHVQRNSGVGFRAESGNIPTAGNQAWQDFQITYKFAHAHIQLSAQSMAQSKTSRGAFEKVYDAEIMGAAKDLGRTRNRALFGFGRGDLAQVNGAVTAGTLVNVNNTQGVANNQLPARFFKVNDLVAFVTTGGVLDAVATVSALSLANNTITTAANVTVSNGDFIVQASTLSDAIGSTAYNNEIMGLLGMVDDGTYVTTYFNINRTTYPLLKSGRIDLGGGNLTLDIMQKAWDVANQQSNGEIDAWVCHHTTLREHLKNTVEFRRYIGKDALAPDVGFKGGGMDSEITFNGAPIVVDRDAPYGIIFGVDTDYLCRYVLEEGKWADNDGTILLRLSGSDDYEARFRVFDNFVYENPNTGVVISTIALSAAPEAIQVI